MEVRGAPVPPRRRPPPQGNPCSYARPRRASRTRAKLDYPRRSRRYRMLAVARLVRVEVAAEPLPRPRPLPGLVRTVEVLPHPRPPPTPAYRPQRSGLATGLLPQAGLAKVLV